MFSFDYIKIAQYRFTFIPDDFIIMPEKGKGNVIRGAFGTTLKRICCINQNLVDCKDCLDRSKGFKDSRIRGFKWKKIEDWRVGRLEGWRVGRLEGWLPIYTSKHLIF